MQQLKDRFFVHPAFVWVLVILSLTLALPLSWMYLSLMVLFIMPVLSIWLSYDRQKLWAPLSLALIFAALVKSIGPLYGFIAVVYLLPISACVWLCTQKDVSLLKSMVLSMITYGSTILVFTLLVRTIWGVNAIDIAATYVIEKIQGLPYLDEVLYILLSNGFLSQVGLLDGAPIFVEGVQGIVLTQVARAELLMQIQSIIIQYLSLLLPSLLISYNILLSSCGLAFAQSYSKTSHILPRSLPFSKWQLPLEAKNYWWIALLIYASSFMVEGSLSYPLAYLTQAIATVFIALRLSFLAFTTRRFRSKNIRLILLIIAYFMFPQFLAIIGYAEWVFNLKNRHFSTQTNDQIRRNKE